MERSAMERAFRMMVATNMDLTMSKKCKLKIAPLEGLKPMELRELHASEMQEEVCFEGRVVYGVIRASAKSGKSGLVLCVLETEDGLCALVNIFNALKSTETTKDAESRFPKGLRVAVKEPVGFKHCLHIPCPSSMEFIGIGRRLKYRSLDDLKSQGNGFFQEGNYVMAEQYYNECIKVYNSKGKNREEEYVTILSNRAETRLKLGKFEAAIVDASGALEIDHEHVKSLCRKGRGLRAVQEHEQALVCFESALKFCTDKASIADLNKEIQKCKTFLRQSQNGEYDLGDFLLSGMEERLLPECSDYVGPLELKLTPDGRGRGLFASRDLKVGELLLVCNPVASSRSGYAFDEDDLFVEILRASTTCDRNLTQVYSLADSPVMNELPEDASCFFTNVTKSAKSVPSSISAPARVLDIGRIRRVQNRVSFALSQKGGADITGLWSSVALINHSCLPNVSKVGFGPVVFIRASRKVKAGEELVFSYSEPLAPWSHRKQVSTRLGFDCSCKRCKVEKDKETSFADIPHLTYAKREDMVISELVIAQEIEKRLSAIDDLSEEEMDWIRAGYANLYAACMVPTFMASFTGRAPPPAASRFGAGLRGLLPKAGSSSSTFRTHEQILKALHETAPGNTQTLARMVSVYTQRPSGTGKKLVMEECTAIYGKQPLEVMDAIIRWRQED